MSFASSHSHGYAPISEIESANRAPERDITVPKATLMDFPLSDSRDLQCATVRLPGEDIPILKSGCNDMWCTALFLINIIIVIYLEISSPFSITLFLRKNLESSLFILIVSLMISSLVLGILLLYFLIKNSQEIIQMSIRFSIFSGIVAAITSLVSGEWVVSLFWLLLACMTYCYYYAVQSRIPFTASVLKISATVIQENFCGLSLLSFTLMALQVLWFGAWTVAFLSYAASMSGWTVTKTTISASKEGSSVSTDNENLNGFVLFWYLFVLYWGSSVLRLFLHTVVAGTVGSWWFNKQRLNVVRGSIVRSLWSNFGTICFGGLVVSFLHTVRVMAESAARRARDRRRRDHSGGAAGGIGAEILACIVLSCLRALEGLAEYMNSYALCYAAVYNDAFIPAGKATWKLFTNRGWTMIINDNLAGNALSFMALSLGVVNGTAFGVVAAVYKTSLLIAMHLQHQEVTTSPLIYTAIGIGFMIGLLVGLLIASVIHSAYQTVFVCAAESPYALEMTHFEAYEELMTAWKAAYPHSFDWMVSGQAIKAEAEIVDGPVFAHAHRTPDKTDEL